MKLVVQSGPDAGQEFPVMGSRVAIGREIASDIVLHENEVSRRHAEIRQTETGYAIADLNSTNGTFVNEARVSAPQPLHPGDRIRVGSTTLSLEEGAAGPITVPEWAPPVEKERGMLPFLLIAAIIVVAVVVLVARERPPLPVLATATPTAISTSTVAPAVATSTPLPSRTPSRVPSAAPTVMSVVLCPNPDVRITSPLPGAKLEGVAEIFGTASIDQFAFYKLEYGVGWLPAVWSAIGGPIHSAARDARLAVWDTTALPEGDYTLRLTVVDSSGNYPLPCEVKVYIKR